MSFSVFTAYQVRPQCEGRSLHWCSKTVALLVQHCNGRRDGQFRPDAEGVPCVVVDHLHAGCSKHAPIRLGESAVNQLRVKTSRDEIHSSVNVLHLCNDGKITEEDYSL